MKAYLWLAALAALLVSQLVILEQIVQAVLHRNYLMLAVMACVYMLAGKAILDKVLAEWGDEEELD